MRTITIATLIALGCWGCGRSKVEFTTGSGSSSGSSASEPGRRTPDQRAATQPEAAMRFEEVAVQGDGGHVLKGPADPRSAQKSVRSAVAGLEAKLGEKPRLGHAIGTRTDDAAQAYFSTSNMSGLILVDKESVVVLFDRSDRFGETFPRLRQCLIPPSREVELFQVNIPNGLGTMWLPQGWTFTGATPEGMISVAGPQGMADFSTYCTVWTPEAAAQCWVRPPKVASFGDVAQTWKEMFPQLNAMYVQAGQPGVTWTRLIEQAPAPFMPGKAAWLHVAFEYGGAPWEGVYLVACMPNGDGATFTIYISDVTAPESIFPQSLPTLLRIWAGWKTSDAVFAQRMADAMKNMTRCNEIIQEVTVNRARASHVAAENWDRYIRGRTPVHNGATGEDGEVPNDQLPNLPEFNNKTGGDWQPIKP